MAILSIAILCGGCASLPVIPNLSPEQISLNCPITRDNFKKVTWVQGMVALFFVDLEQNEFQLRARKSDESSEVYFDLIMRTHRSPWEGPAIWNDAYDHEGRQLLNPEYNVSCETDGWVDESVSFDVSRKWIEDLADSSGIQVQVYGKHDRIIMNLAGNYARGFLDKVDQTVGRPDFTP